MINFNEILEPKKAEILLNALKCSDNEDFHKLILENLQNIILWLNSKDFENYKNNKYPPLFNPETIELEASEYCANLAWDFNIPLKNIKFIYISPHGVGAAAFLTLLNEACKVFSLASWMLEEDCKYRYALNFIASMIKNQIAINISEINIKDIDKYLALIDKNTPIIYQARDPISLIKHSYGRDWSKVERRYERVFDINYDYRLYIQYLTPNKTYINDDFEKLLDGTFINHYLLDKINIDKIYYLDMSEISEKNAYNTFIKLANDFSFTPPPINTKELFKRKEFRGYIRYLFPLTF
ncbi:DUF2972 domain-containing protein, partial [Campylobacter volucris]|uniref:DUF2972 domain-containing protein n=1 Tax=Campylobacter volucris TaxID=1031542 RepID=UPI00189D1C6A